MLPYRTLLYFGVFLLLTSIVYSICPKNKRYIALLASSMLFYTVYTKIGVIFVLITILTTYLFSNWICSISDRFDLTGLEKEEKKRIKAIIKLKKKKIVALYILINIGILIILKYFNFFAHCTIGVINNFGMSVNTPVIHVILPLGISYYTLQALGYIIDIYRGKYLPEKNLFKLALFIGYFPQLYEGPFGRFDDLIPQLTAGEDIKADNVYSGIFKLLCGLFKLFMISNRAAIIVDSVFKNYSEFNGISIAFGVIAFTVQLYAEFSGYIDIASGISMVFGITLTKNFDMPFISQNIGEFWRRWHISLGTWFRDYVFYSASTSKLLSKPFKSIKNYSIQSFITISFSMLIVWFLTGLWHGASAKYIVYGLYYFVLMIIFNALNPVVNRLLDKHKIAQDNIILVTVRICKTLILVCIGMMIFRAPDMSEFNKMFMAMLSHNGTRTIISTIESKDLIMLITSLTVLIAVSIMRLKNKDLEVVFNSLSSYKKYWICFAIFCIVIVFGAYGLGYLPPDPIYGGF